MTITFSGLASGLDTSSLVDSLMELERAPLDRVEVDKEWQSSRLAAFKQFDTTLNSFLNNINSLGDYEQYYRMNASAGSDEYFSVSASNDAAAGTYRVSVEALSQVQKSYSNATDGLGNDIGFSSKDDAILGTGDVEITVNGTAHTITLDSENNSLQGLMTAINEADIGISASIINDGSSSPYRLAITASSVENVFSVDTSALAGGTESFHNFAVSQAAQQAHITVDGIDVYSDSNTFTDTITGVTIDLLQAEPGTQTTISVSEDHSALETNLNAFVAGYNGVVSFITGQSAYGDTEAGILAGDSGLNSVKRHLQDMLTSFTDNEGAFSVLSQVGFETQSDGTIALNSTTLGEAIDQDYDSLVSLLAGTEEDDEDGVMAEFVDYLTSMTDSSSGFYAGREEAINANIASMDKRIEIMELRLAKREDTLLAQFSAMETLISSMNTQSDFLTQQLSYISNLTSGNN